MNTSYSNYLLRLCFGIILFALTATAQLRPLSEYDKAQIKQNIANSADWHTILDFERMMLMFPDNRMTYQAQINAIMELYRHTLHGIVVMQEEQQWQQYLQNLEINNQFGHGNQPTQQSIAAAQERQRAGKPPEPTHQEKIQRQVTDALNEAWERSREVAQTGYYQSIEYLQDLPHYENAIEAISQMLEGKRALSIKDAYYKAEAAYGNLHLTYEEYNSLIASNAGFVRQWLTENKFDLRDPEALHYGIQKFMSDTLYITVRGKRVGHMPYFYDYIDFNAKQDRRNYFVTKTLSTGTGQCHTFPVTYLILAEAMDVEAYLSYSPRHSFIRYKNNRGVMVNYETTVDRILVDAFYKQTLPVMAAAQKNEVYIRSLTKKQVVATVLFDLAADFIKEHWVADGQIIRRCLTIGKAHFPNQEYINGSESYLRQRLYANEINSLVEAKKITNAEDLEKHPEIIKVYNNYMAYMERITKIGVQEFPAEEELRFAQYADEKGRLMKAKGINSKQKRTLFIR